MNISKLFFLSILCTTLQTSADTTAYQKQVLQEVKELKNLLTSYSETIRHDPNDWNVENAQNALHNFNPKINNFYTKCSKDSKELADKQSANLDASEELYTNFDQLQQKKEVVREEHALRHEQCALFTKLLKELLALQEKMVPYNQEKRAEYMIQKHRANMSAEGII